jgi:hypothetical protein
MAREDEMAMTLALNESEREKKAALAKANELRRHVDPLGRLAHGLVAGATGLGLGLVEGYRDKGDAAVMKATEYDAPVAAIVAGTVGAVAAAKAGHTKTAAAAASVATGGVTVLGYKVGRETGVRGALEAEKRRLAAPAQGAQGVGPSIRKS